MDAPQAIKDVFRRETTSWERPKFVYYVNGQLWYRTTACSDAGGCQHSFYFPVTPSGRRLGAEEKWETLTDDAVQAVKSKTFQTNFFAAEH